MAEFNIDDWLQDILENTNNYYATSEVNDTNALLEPIYDGHNSSILAVLLAFFSFVQNYGRNSPKFANKLLSLVLLCFPINHKFPSNISHSKKV